VVGARSALFMPYADLGLIVSMKEHDQPTSRATARIIMPATWRGAGADRKIPIILASATPSSETEVERPQGPLSARALPSRFGGRTCRIASDRSAPRAAATGRFISPPLAEQIKFAIEKREQALLFLNRRGYAPLTLCRACGHRFACTICDAWLVTIGFGGGWSAPLRFSMPRRISFALSGEESLSQSPRRRAPAGRSRATVSGSPHHGAVERPDYVDRDQAQRTERNRGRARRHHHRHATGGQGHNFPRLNLVGVVDADLGLGNGDPRAAERTCNG